MTEKLVFLDFEVEAHGCLPERIDCLTTTHPRGEYEVTIRNLAVEPGVDRPLLSFHLVMPGDDLEVAKESGEAALKSFLRYLTFVTQLSFRIHALKKVVDWSPGVTGRDCLHYLRKPGYGLPLPAIESDILESLRFLQECEMDPTNDRALRWFASGVSARFSDDQFQFFWLVVELLAVVTKDPGKVPDVCPKCRNPLYCESCEDHPTHRPYPRQAIEQLFVRMLPDSGSNLFEKMNKIRNAIMHGEDVREVVDRLGDKLEAFVDKLGRIAWQALLDVLVRRHREPPTAEFRFSNASTFAHLVYQVCTHMVVYGADPQHPTVERLSMPDVSLVYGNQESEPG